MRWFKLPEWFYDPWNPTASNRWGVVVEESTKDGRYRHRRFDDQLNPLPWVPGPHQIAQKLRDEGKIETDDFRERRTWNVK